MKRNYFSVILGIAVISILASCGKEDECHECHIAYDGPNGEIEVEIGEFCGSELEDVEAPGYSHTISQTIVGNDTVPAGSYSEIHCEEHADHDH